MPSAPFKEGATGTGHTKPRSTKTWCSIGREGGLFLFFVYLWHRCQKVGQARAYK